MTKKQTYYKKYPELLLDEKFLRWRLSPDTDADTYWLELQQQYPQLKEEIALADRYIKNRTFKKNALQSNDKAAMLLKIRESLSRDKRKHLIQSWIKYGVAASILIVLGVSIFIANSHRAQRQEVIAGNIMKSENIQLITGDKAQTFKENISLKVNSDGIAQVQENNESKTDIRIAQHTMNTLIVPYGKRSSIELSDGTKIHLNAGSSLEFPAAFGNESRKVTLKGEMYIEVARDAKRPFHVQTQQFGVQVLGTTFNVSAYENQPQSVTLVEGSVRLQTENKQQIRLAPNQMARYTPSGNFEKQNVDVTQYISWKDGYLVFDETPVSEVLTYIARYYNLSFNYDNDTNLRNATCKGKLYLSENVDNVMNSIALLSSTRYRRENGKIFLTNNPKK